MIDLARAALCADCDLIFEIQEACPRCASTTFLTLGRTALGGNGARASLPAGESAPLAPAGVPRDPLRAFFLRWGAWFPPRVADEFQMELAVLVTLEQARIRRRLTTSFAAYRQACDETLGEAVLHAKEGR